MTYLIYLDLPTFFIILVISISDLPFFRPCSDSSDGIIFEKDEVVTSCLQSQTGSCSVSDTDCDQKKDSAVAHCKEIQFMFIQMEFCEKSTLR